MDKTVPFLHRKQPQSTRRKQPQQIIRSSHIPLDLAEEVLSRLPVKQLLKLRCVCKSWSSLISEDSKFAKKNLLLSTSCHNRQHLILTPTHSSPLPEILLLHSPISSIFNSAPISRVAESIGSISKIRVAHSSYPLRGIINKGAYGNGSSTCDGMLCFRIDDSLALLCNPSIRKFKKLPPFEFPDHNCGEILYTLVHDCFASNYKVIAANFLISKTEVYVYTLGTNYWRRIQDFPGPEIEPIPLPGIFVNDSVNWLTFAIGGSEPSITSLDLAKQSYQKLSLPVFEKSETFFITPGTLRGCLSLLYCMQGFSDVWIMKEFGIQKSWTKLLSVPYMKACGRHGYTRALYISEDDQVLLEFIKKEKFRLAVYDSINKTYKIPKFQNNNQGEMAPEIYVESLISPL